MKIAQRYLKRGESVYTSRQVLGGYQATVQLTCLPEEFQPARSPLISSILGPQFLEHMEQYEQMFENTETVEQCFESVPLPWHQW